VIKSRPRRDRVDLHTHSTASDGTLRPSEVVRQAAGHGAAAIALTDHDSIDGVAEAVAEGARLGVEVVSGIEISAEFGPGTMHILGLFVDPAAPAFSAGMARMQAARRQRNPQIIERLQAAGVSITYDEVVAASGGGQVGRPHFARVLIDKGYARDMNDAFDRYLKRGARAYAERFRFAPAESIALIHQAGGVAVLAHPATLGLAPEGLRAELARLTAAGLDGLEVSYSAHSVADEARLRLLAQDLGLAESGGSDFHGAHKPDIRPVIGRGHLAVPVAVLEELRRRRPRAAARSERN
jgi:predicted metal-dependent phosphoesterase TrpH